MIARTIKDYVFEESRLVDIFGKTEESKIKCRNRSFLRVCDYTRLLNCELTKGMFAPCDLDGEELTEPDPKKTSQESYPYDLESWNSANERVLFNIGLIMDFKVIKYRYSDVEGICNSNYDSEIEFNKKAIKHYIGFNRIDK